MIRFSNQKSPQIGASGGGVVVVVVSDKGLTEIQSQLLSHDPQPDQEMQMRSAMTTPGTSGTKGVVVNVVPKMQQVGLSRIVQPDLLLQFTFSGLG